MNTCFKHVWSVSRQRFVVVSELTRGHRPSKDRAVKALSALVLGLLGSSAMANPIVDGMVVKTDPAPVVVTSFNALESLIQDPAEQASGVLYTHAPLKYTLNKGISTFKVYKKTPSLGFKYMDNIDGFFAWDGKAAVLVGYEADEAETALFQNLPNRGSPKKDNAALVADGGYVQLGHKDGGKKHGFLGRFGVTTGEGAVVNGDFTVRETIFLGSNISNADALLTIEDGASLSVKGKFYVREHGTAVINGAVTTTGPVSSSYVVNLNSLTVGPNGSLTTTKITNNGNGYTGTITNDGVVTLTEASKTGGTFINNNTLNAPTFTATGVFTNNRTAEISTLTVDGQDSSFTTAADATTSGTHLTVAGGTNNDPNLNVQFVSSGTVNYPNVTFNNGSRTKLLTGTFNPTAAIDYAGGTLEVGQEAPATDKMAFHVANITRSMNTALVVHDTGTLFLDNGTATVDNGHLYFAKPLALASRGSLSVTHANPVAGGSAHLGANSITTIDFAAIKPGNTPILTTDNGTLSIDAGATLKLINVADVNPATKRYALAKGFTLSNVDGTRHWTGGWTGATSNSADHELSLSWLNNPDDPESATYEDKTLYLVIKTKGDNTELGGDGGETVKPEMKDAETQTDLSGPVDPHVDKPEMKDEATQVKPETTDQGTQVKPDTKEEGTQAKPDTSESGVQVQPDTSESGTQVQPDVAEGGSQTEDGDIEPDPSDFSDTPMNPEGLFEHGKLAVESFNARSRVLWRTEHPEFGRTLWVDLLGEDRHAGARLGYKLRRYGVVLGADRRLGDADEGLLGVALSAARGTGETTHQWAGTDTKLKNWGAYLYGAYRYNNQIVNGHVGYVSQKNRLTRGDHSADVKERMVTAGATLSQRFVFDNEHVLIPHIGVMAGWIKGTHYDVKIDGQAVETKTIDRLHLIDLPIGVSWDGKVKNIKGWDVTPKADVTYTKPIGDKTMHISSDGFLTHPFDRALQGTTTSASVGFEAVKPDYEVSARYRYTAGSGHYHAHDLMIRLVRNF